MRRTQPSASYSDGAITLEKNLEPLPLALEGLRAELWLVGEGPLRSALEALARERGLAVRFLYITGARTIEAEGMLAVCIQHEMDHLKGKVFVEYLSMLKQGRIRTKLAKASKAGQD